MGKIITAKIDFNKLDKARFFKGKPDQSGHTPLWIDIVLVERKEPGRFGDTHFITQAASKEERTNKVKMPIIGNATERSFDGGKSQSAPPRESPRSTYQRRPEPRHDDAEEPSF